jgi:hypothetical protein
MRRVMTSTGRSSVVRPTQFHTDDVVSGNRALRILPFYLSSNGQQFTNASFKHGTLQAVCAPMSSIRLRNLNIFW